MTLLRGFREREAVREEPPEATETGKLILE